MQMEESLRKVRQPCHREEQQPATAATSGRRSIPSGSVQLPPHDSEPDETPVRGLVPGREGDQVLNRGLRCT